MDLGDKDDNFALENRNGDPMKYHPSGISADWQLGNLPIGLVQTAVPVCRADQMASSQCPSASMADSFLSTIWSHPGTSHNLAFSDNNIHTCESNSHNVTIGNPAAGPSSWNPPDSLLKGGAFFLTAPGILPPSLAHFPADASFIERAARFSCFNSSSFGGIANPFPSTPYPNARQVVLGAQVQRPELNADSSVPLDHGSNSGSPMKSQRDRGSSQGVAASSNESGEPELSGDGQEEAANLGGAGGDAASKGLNAKKRRKNYQDMELDQVQGAPASSPAQGTNVDTKHKGGHNSSTMATATGKPTGKNAKDGSEPPKEDYIHVRARRGQATNSHSLAERVRREKISERMKFLQDLVPGCSKVTGKAVMLDEIINYVQSLQRQVEFLSMKLAAVNPRLDINAEGILTKDLLQPRGGPSTIGFSPDIIHPQLHSPHHGLVQSGIPGISNPSVALRRTINAQLTAMSGYREHMSQMPTAWDEELHNIVQMNYGANPTLSAQDLNGKPHEGFSL